MFAEISIFDAKFRPARVVLSSGEVRYPLAPLLIRLDGMTKSAKNRGNGDQLAVVQTEFIKHGDAIRAYLLALCPDEHAADDLLHSVFMAVTRKAGEFQAGTNFLAWARAIAKIEVLLLARDRARAPRVLSPEVIEQLSTTVPPFEAKGERFEAMRNCIETLAPRTKQSILLRYLENLAPREIAQKMQLGLNSVNVMLSRARTTLRECIERRLRRSEVV